MIIVNQVIENFILKLTDNTIFLSEEEMKIELISIMKKHRVISSYQAQLKKTNKNLINQYQEFIKNDFYEVVADEFINKVKFISEKNDEEVLFIPKNEWKRPVKLLFGRNKNLDISRILKDYFVDPLFVDIFRKESKLSIAKMSQEDLIEYCYESFEKNIKKINDKKKQLPKLAINLDNLNQVLILDSLEKIKKDWKHTILHNLKIYKKSKKLTTKTKIKSEFLKQIFINLDKLSKINNECHNLSRDEFSEQLYNIATEKRLVNNKKNSFSSNQKFSAIYDTPEMSSLLNISLAKVTNAIEYYIYNKANIIPPEYCPTVGPTIDMETWGMITGYFAQTYKHTISKDYNKHTAARRKSREEISINTGSNASTTVNDDPDFASQIIFNQISDDNVETTIESSYFNSKIKQIFKALRNYDRKQNNYLKKYMYKNQEIPQNKKSKLSYLFFWVMHPEMSGGKYSSIIQYKLKHIEESDLKYNYHKSHIEEEIGSSYIFNRDKDLLFEFLKENFSEDLKYLTEFINKSNDSFGETILPKKSKFFNNQSCQINDVFELNKIKDSNLFEFTYKYNMFIIDNGRPKILKTIERKETGNIKDSDRIKEKLKSELVSQKSDLEREKNSILNHAYQNLYIYKHVA